MPVLITSYSETNQDSSNALDSAQSHQIGQSFNNPSLVTLDSCKWYIKKSGSPTGNATARIYASTGTLGTDSKPTGAALATSDNFDVSTLSTSFALVTFTFSGVAQIPLVAATDYIVVIQFAGGDGGGNEVNVGCDVSSPSFAGNYSETQNDVTWSAFSTIDNCFYIYAADAAGANVNGRSRMMNGIGR